MGNDSVGNAECNIDYLTYEVDKLRSAEIKVIKKVKYRLIDDEVEKIGHPIQLDQNEETDPANQEFWRIWFRDGEREGVSNLCTPIGEPWLTYESREEEPPKDWPFPVENTGRKLLVVTHPGWNAMVQKRESRARDYRNHYPGVLAEIIQALTGKSLDPNDTEQQSHSEGFTFNLEEQLQSLCKGKEEASTLR